MGINRQDTIAGLIIAGVFIASRAAFYLLGGRYVDKPLTFAMQYLDPQLLQHDLLRSLVYLHAQPPGFNFFLGSVLKIAGGSGTAFALIFMAAGLIALLCLYGLLRAMGLAMAAGLAFTMLFMFNPTVLLYENLLYYTYAEWVLIACAACLLRLWSLRPGLGRAVAFWAVMGCLGLVRSMFHPVFLMAFLLAAAALMTLIKIPRRCILLFCAASLVAIGPLGAVAAKNRVLYGFWGTSSWEGMNLWTKACGYGPEELEGLHGKGIISDLALQAGLEPFRPLDQYEDAGPLLGAACHHRADCDQYKSTGKPNYNHAGYAVLSRQLRRDALAVIKNDPQRFAFQTLASYSLTLWPASDSVHGLFHDNMELLEPLESLYGYACFGFVKVADRYSDPRIWTRTALVTALYLLVYGAAALRIIRSRGTAETSAALVLFFCCFMHAAVIVVSSVVEFGENNRFRFPVDGAFLVMMAGAARLVPGLRWFISKAPSSVP